MPKDPVHPREVHKGAHGRQKDRLSQPLHREFYILRLQVALERTRLFHRERIDRASLESG